MSIDWDEIASIWDSNEDVVRHSEKAYLSLCEFVTIDNLRVLDFGCGTGCLIGKIAQHADQVVGLDTSLAMLAVLEGKRLPNVITVGEELSFELIANHSYLRNKFDLITASSVCEDLPDYEGTLRLLKSLLVCGGWFVQWDWLGAESDHGFTEAAMLRMLNGVGFDSVSVPFSTAGKNRGVMEVLMGVG